MMPSGTPITEEQEVTIRRMAALRTADGRWKWSYELIATACGVERHAVSECVRRGNAELVRLHDAGHIAFRPPTGG